MNETKDSQNKGDDLGKDSKKETYNVKGSKIVAKIKELIKEGNVRNVRIVSKEGKVLATFPLTFGVVGAVLTPLLAAISVITVLVKECKIEVERTDSEDK